MATKVGINGFGRIGRNIMRAALGSKDLDFVAVNDLTNAATLAHLLKYDSILGNLHGTITAQGDKISVDGDEFQVLSVKDPAQLPWKDLGVDVVFESTGLFTDRDSAGISRPAGVDGVLNFGGRHTAFRRPASVVGDGHPMPATDHRKVRDEVAAVEEREQLVVRQPPIPVDGARSCAHRRRRSSSPPGRLRFAGRGGAAPRPRRPGPA